MLKNPNQISYKTDQEPKQHNWNKQTNLERAVGTFDLALIVKLLICYRFSFDNGQDFDRIGSAEIDISKK